MCCTAHLLRVVSVQSCLHLTPIYTPTNFAAKNADAKPSPSEASAFDPMNEVPHLICPCAVASAVCPFAPRRVSVAD